MAAACPGLVAALQVQASSSDIVCARAAPASSVLLNLWKKITKLRGNFNTVTLNRAEREVLGGKGETGVPKHGLKAAQGCSGREKNNNKPMFSGLC